MFSAVRDFTKNVENCFSRDMKKRQIAAGVETAERSFIRIKGYQHMPKLIAKLKDNAVNNLPTLLDNKLEVGVTYMRRLQLREVQQSLVHTRFLPWYVLNLLDFTR